MLDRAFIACCLLFFAMPIRALEVLLFEDFENTKKDFSSSWDFAAVGDVAFTLRGGSRMLRITPASSAATTVEVRDVTRVRVAATFIASALGDNGACVAEASTDGGLTWFTVLRVIGGQDDGTTRHSGAAWRDLQADRAGIRLRAWLSGGPREAECRLDHVSILGERPGKRASASSPRRLTKDLLVSAEPLAKPVPTDEFARPAGAEDPGAIFSGSLEFAGGAPADGFEALIDPRGRVAEVGEPIRQLPPFEIGILQRGDDLVPLHQSLRPARHPYWEIVFLPGKAWQEPEDGDWTRAALPFALQERAANCTHNGVMTWLFNDRGEVSRAAYQIASETCGYFKFDMWGVAAATYAPEDLAEQAAPHLERFAANRRSRLPVRPLAALAAEFPGIDASGFGVDDGIHPNDITVVGIVADGIHYRSECRTRQGPHPFCASLPLPSYSTAKSIFAGIAVMRLEKLNPGFSQRSIASLIDARCDPRRWRDVTVENALDMATGNFRSQAFEEDENSVPHEWFVFADNDRDKLSFACNFFPRKTEPGTRFVYHTSDTYVLGTALAGFVASRSEDADLYRSVLLEPIWRGLELSPLLDETRRTYDAVAQPFTGYGLTYEADDIVRVAAWLQNGARLGDTPLLDPAMLDAALQRRPADRGLPAGTPGLRYNNGFWGFDAGPSLGCAREVWVPFMSGVSGITVAMFPNGVIYYYFSDSYVFRWQSAREAAHRIAALC